MTAVIAHRGCTDGPLENTIDAFVEARRLGADGVELDVHLTADGALAVHHDADIEGVGPLWSLGVSDLPESVPLLGEVLAVCAPMVINVEIKHESAEGAPGDERVAQAVARAIDEANWSDRVIISSFNVAILAAVRHADERLAIGELWPFLSDPEAGLARATSHQWQAVHPFVTEVSAELVERSHRVGLEVNAWTVNATHDLVAFVGLGVDAVITDNLTEAIEIARSVGP